jgi:hypothetical protein
MENYGHFIIAANSEWVVPASMHDERRFAVLNMGEAHRDDKEYFKAITEQMENGGYESLLYFLQNHQYDEAVARTIPQTQALLEQKIRSMPDEYTWWHECLTYGEIGDDFPLRDDTFNYIPSKTFYAVYSKWCERLRRLPLTDNILPKNLHKMVELNKKLKLNSQQKREPHYCLGKLTDLRNEFDKNIGHKLEWSLED